MTPFVTLRGSSFPAELAANSNTLIFRVRAVTPGKVQGQPQRIFQPVLDCISHINGRSLSIGGLSQLT